MTEFDKFLGALKDATEVDMENNKKMLQNNIGHVQEIIGNLAALGQLGGPDPAEQALKALEVAVTANPQMGAVT